MKLRASSLNLIAHARITLKIIYMMQLLILSNQTIFMELFHQSKVNAFINFLHRDKRL